MYTFQPDATVKLTCEGQNTVYSIENMGTMNYIYAEETTTSVTFKIIHKKTKVKWIVHNSFTGAWSVAVKKEEEYLEK